MISERLHQPRGPRRLRRRNVVRLDRAALWKRLALLNRSQNWLAGRAGISPGYLSMPVNEGRAPSGRIRQRMLKALDVENSGKLFRFEEDNDENR